MQVGVVCNGLWFSVGIVFEGMCKVLGINVLMYWVVVSIVYR